MPRQSRLWSALAALAVIVTTPLASLAGAPPVPGPGPTDLPVLAGHVIVVTGTGSVEAVPDRATIALGIGVTRPTAQEAQDQSNGIMEQIVRRVLALGIPREKIQSSTVGLFPQRRPGGLEITGYEAINRVIVTVDDLSLTGRVVDVGVAAGATSVDSLQFGLRDPSPHRTRALRIAVQNAQATAAAIADAAGIGTFRLVRIEETGPFNAPRMGVAVPMGAATPVMPGMLSVTAEVRAMYAF